MQRKRHSINHGFGPDSPGDDVNLHGIPTMRMGKKPLVATRDPFCDITEFYADEDKTDICQPTSVVWWRSPHCRSGERRNRTRASQIAMTPLSRLARYPRSLLSRYACFGLVALMILGLVLTDVNLLSNHAYAVEQVESDENSILTSELSDASEDSEVEEASVSSINNNDSANDTPVTFSTRAATAGLTIDGGTSSSTESVTVAPGSVGYSKEHTIGVNVSEASAYTLKISGNTNLSGPSGATAIGGAGNKTPANMTDNTWGYGWGSTGTAKESLYYQSLSASGANLSVDSLSASGNASFSRKLVFAAKFGANNTNSGTYRGNVTLSLVVTPRAIGEWRMSNATSSGYDSASTIKNSGITTMQQMTSSICNQVSTPASSSTTVPTMRLKDSRDNNEYIIAKFADGRCWMTDDLLLKGPLTLTSSDSDVSSYFLPATLTSLSSSDFVFNDKYESKSYIADTANSGTTVYYNFYTASAAAAKSDISYGTMSTSICPKGWKLPSGSSGGEYQTFMTAESIANSSDGSTKIQAAPYSFKYTGYVTDGRLINLNYARWWADTVYNNAIAYDLLLDGVRVLVSGSGTRSDGFAVRCIARN